MILVRCVVSCTRAELHSSFFLCHRRPGFHIGQNFAAVMECVSRRLRLRLSSTVLVGTRTLEVCSAWLLRATCAQCQPLDSVLGGSYVL